MSIKVLAIINPASGRGNVLEKVDEIKKNLEEQDMEIDVKITKKDYNARRIIEDYEKEKDLILICGGDGTLNEAVNICYRLAKPGEAVLLSPACASGVERYI